MNKILKCLNKSVCRHGNKLALIDENIQLTYDEVNQLSSLLAEYIIELTQGEVEKPIVIYMGRSVYFVIAILAVLKSGCYYIPIEYPFPIERINFIKMDIKSNIIIVDNNTLNELKGVDSEIKLINPLDINTEEMKCSKIIRANSHDNNLCYTIYTSGTTGYPKGVCIQYNSLYNLVMSLFDAIYKEIPDNSRVALLASFSFDSSVKQIYCSLLFGHTLVISDKGTKYFGRKLLNFYSEWNIYLTDITPTLIRNIVLQSNKSIRCTVQYFLIGGEILTWQCVNEFVEKIGYLPKLVNLYGPTECCVDVSYYNIPYTKKIERGLVPIGKAIRNVQLDLVDDKGNYVTGTIGELLVTGVCVARGYVHKDEFNKFGVSNLVPNVRTYRTGDMAYKKPDGTYIIISRKDDQIKINGNRVELSEIELALKAHPFILDCVVLFDNNKLYCFAISSRKGELGLYTYLKNRLPNYMIPTSLLILDSLPINHNGKINKKVLQDLIQTKDKQFLLLKDW